MLKSWIRLILDHPQLLSHRHGRHIAHIIISKGNATDVINFTFFFMLVSLKHLSDMSCWAVQVCFSAKRHVKNNFRGCFLCRRQPFDGNALSPSGVTKPLGCVTNSNHMTAEDMHQNSEGKNWFSIIASKTIRRSRCAALKQVPSGYCKPPSQIVKLSYIVSMRFILLVPTEKRSLDY